jgi:hypothetical protein
MNERLPDWLERWLGLPDASAGEGTLWRLEHTWRLAPALTVLLAALGAGYIAFLYSRERKSAGALVRGFLTALRVAAFGAVLWMIAEWVLALERSGLPYAVVMIDGSASMATVDRYDDAKLQAAVKKLIGTEDASTTSRMQLAQSILARDNAAALRRLSGQQRLRIYAVSDAAKRIDGELPELRKAIAALDAQGETSRLGDGVRTVLDELRGTPPSAIVLLTDGINTDGESLADAAQVARRQGVPLYAIAIGSSRPVKDVALTDLLADDVVFVNDVAQFEFSVAATGYENQAVVAQLVNVQTGETLAETPLTLGANGVPQRARLTFRPTEEGQLELAVRIAPFADEADAENNQETRTIEVRKDKLRVLMVWWQPSLEFRRLKAMLERETSIDLKTVLQDADLEYSASDRTALKVFPADRDELFQFDVILFGDANPAFLGADALRHLEEFVTEKGGGLAIVAGPHFTPRSLRGTPLEKLLPVELDASVALTTGPAVEGFAPALTDLGAASPGFQMGDSIAETPALWAKLPPWYWFDPASAARPGARVLVEHPTQLGADGKPRPLIAMQFAGAGKVLYHATDETYRWRFRVGDAYFGRYWLQTIRYLSRPKLADENRIAEITADRREYRRGESPRLRVRFADDRRAPAEDDGVSVVVERQGQRKQTVRLARSSAERGIFEGTLPQPSEGKYHVWISSPSFAGKPPSVDFRVIPPPGETQRIEADEAELRRAADVSRGRAYTLANADRLWRDLPSGQPIPVGALPPIVLWNQWPVLALVLTLLITEWLVRKRKGLL